MVRPCWATSNPGVNSGVFGMATPRAHTNRREDRRVFEAVARWNWNWADKPDRSVNVRIARAGFPALRTFNAVRLQLTAEPSADGVLSKSSPCRIRSQFARGDVLRRTLGQPTPKAPRS